MNNKKSAFCTFFIDFKKNKSIIKFVILLKLKNG